MAFSHALLSITFLKTIRILCRFLMPMCHISNPLLSNSPENYDVFISHFFPSQVLKNITAKSAVKLLVFGTLAATVSISNF